MKKISVVVPCYNEENSVIEMYNRIRKVFETRLTNYEYELIYVDDYSKDNTREIIRELCGQDKHVKAVFNMANFGFSRNIFSSILQGDGDAVFLVFGDLQDPPELLPQFVKKWEEGSKVVIGKKIRSDENKFMCFMRSCYYFWIDELSEKKQIRHFNGYGLYDKKFVKVISEIEDSQPYIKAVVSEYAAGYAVVEYAHKKSSRGKSNFNLYKNYDFAMEGITSSTKKLMRIATFSGAVLGLLCAVYGIFVFIRKLLFWSSYPLGMASLSVGIFLLGAIQLFFIGILGEYVLSINTRTMRKPRVVIDEKINFDEQAEQENGMED